MGPVSLMHDTTGPTALPGTPAAAVYSPSSLSHQSPCFLHSPPTGTVDSGHFPRTCSLPLCALLGGLPLGACEQQLTTPVCPVQIPAPPDLRPAFLTSPQEMPLLLLTGHSEQDRAATEVPTSMEQVAWGYLSVLLLKGVHLRDQKTSTFNRLCLLKWKCVP